MIWCFLHFITGRCLHQKHLYLSLVWIMQMKVHNLTFLVITHKERTSDMVDG